jgi:hypothetical protein
MLLKAYEEMGEAGLASTSASQIEATSILAPGNADTQCSLIGVLTNLCTKHERNKLFVHMEHFWDLFIQLMKLGTNALHLYFCLIYDFSNHPAMLSKELARSKCCNSSAIPEPATKNRNN